MYISLRRLIHQLGKLAAKMAAEMAAEMAVLYTWAVCEPVQICMGNTGNFETLLIQP